MEIDILHTMEAGKLDEETERRIYHKMSYLNKIHQDSFKNLIRLWNFMQ